MPTILRTLEAKKEDRESLHDMCLSIFLDGECYAFAMALSQGLGWPMVGLMQDEIVLHACVRSPDGRLHDVRGFVSEKEFAKPFRKPPYELREITESDLRAIRPVHVRAIAYTRRMAETIWPDLPWINSSAAKAIAFADELETLCRKHGFWITGGVPANPPRLFVTGDDEGGYELRPTLDGLAFTINRYLV